MNADVTNYFAILQLPLGCELDEELLERQYRKLQQQWHPDRKAAATEPEKRQALQQASLINDAYATLKTPLSRAAHLLHLVGVDTGQHSQSQLDPAFLLQQMHWRDELEEAGRKADMQALELLRGRVEKAQEQLWSEFRTNYESGDPGKAQQRFYELQFMQRLSDETRAAEDRLLGY
jgi:molecular chaperone HscB